jgi:hypothetical protein
VTVDTRTISPAGDPFTAAPAQGLPHACIDDVVYIGHVVHMDDGGEEVEVFEAMPCRRCEQES